MKSILEHEILSSRFFFAEKVSIDEPFFITSKDGVKLGCYYAKESNNKKTIIHFHGNGELVRDYIYDFVPKILRLGFNILLVEYRGYRMSESSPTLLNILEDVESIVESIDVDLKDVILFGRSLGSLYALHGAYLFPNIGGLIIESGVSDVFDRVKLRAKTKELNTTIDELLVECNRYFDYKKKLSNYKGRVLNYKEVREFLSLP